ncbi:MAG TPA: sigma-70 family RNA polymerase sigma factor [Bryobacteraceae bacterium]|nr:sigma-70 family RNA polymerase sigma factor [Bryobacteraceae bacterium]
MSGETFADLLAPNLTAIRKLVHAKTRMPDHAEDVVQQALLHAFVHRDQLRVHSKFKSWVSTIAMNEIRGLARRTRLSVPFDAAPVLASTDKSSCPYKSYEQQERLTTLRDGLAQLSERDRRTIDLMDLSEMRLSEAARMLSVSQAALKSAHFRARQRLGHAVRGKRTTAAERRK